MSPKISVLVPVYNAEQYLSNCLNSILQQTFQDFEVVCLNDGSLDKSFGILEEFAQKDKRVRVLSQKNSGVANTRNRLLDEAKAAYIAFVDADDWVEPTYLEKLYQKAQESGADVTKCFFKEIDAVSQKISQAKKYSFSSSALEKIADKVKHGYEDPVVWGKLWRTDFLRQNALRFLPGYVAEDLAWVSLGFVQANKIVLLEEDLYVYRKGVEGAITSNETNMILGKLRNILFIKEELEKRKQLDAEGSLFLLKLLVWHICNLRKIPKQKQKENETLFFRGIEAVNNLFSHVCWKKRMRFGLWSFLAGGRPSRRFYFWSKVFR